MSNLTQIALDFGDEPQAQPSSSAANGDGGEAFARPYMAAGGVGVRIKSYKQTPPASATGDLFGGPAEPATQSATIEAAKPSVEELPVEQPLTVAAEPT